MAIGSYYDVYNVDSYERRVSNISQSIASLSSGDFYFDARNQLIAQIDILKTKEQKLFNLLGVSSIEELNKALQERNSTNALLEYCELKTKKNSKVLARQ